MADNGTETKSFVAISSTLKSRSIIVIGYELLAITYHLFYFGCSCPLERRLFQIITEDPRSRDRCMCRLEIG